MKSLSLPPMSILATAAAELARAAHEAGDKANENALNNAMYDLHTGSVPIATCGGFLVRSSTRNLAHRVSNVYGCNCEAGSKGKPCRHQAQIEIIEAAQVRAIPVVDRLVAWRKALIEVNELY
jgi:hypothetical protein